MSTSLLLKGKYFWWCLNDANGPWRKEQMNHQLGARNGEIFFPNVCPIHCLAVCTRGRILGCCSPANSKMISIRSQNYFCFRNKRLQTKWSGLRGQINVGWFLHTDTPKHRNPYNLCSVTDESESYLLIWYLSSWFS